MFGRLGGIELLVILVVGFLIFGTKKLPEIGKSFGDTIREFKKSAEDDVNTEESKKSKDN